MATQTVTDLGRATSWVAAAALTSGLVVVPASEDPLAQPRRIEHRDYAIAITTAEVVFDVVMAESGSVFGVTADAVLESGPLARHPIVEAAEDEPLFVEVVAPTIRVRARVRSVDRSTAYDGTAFERGNDDDV